MRKMKFRKTKVANLAKFIQFLKEDLGLEHMYISLIGHCDFSRFLVCLQLQIILGPCFRTSPISPRSLSLRIPFPENLGYREGIINSPDHSLAE
jgi:hypothetical protein